MGKVIADLELDRGDLEPAHVVNQLGEAARPATGLPALDRLERIALAWSTRSSMKEAHRRVGGLAGLRSCSRANPRIASFGHERRPTVGKRNERASAASVRQTPAYIRRR